MQTKTYFASSVPAALELARKELGEEAMLVTSKPSSPEGRPYGRLEVTFAFERVAASVRRAAEYPNFAAASRVPTERTYDAGPQSEMDDIRRQISELKLAVTRPNQRIPASADIAPERIPVAPPPELKPGESRTVALIGPPGRGKTTTLIKIAMRFGLSKRVPVKIYQGGSHGVGHEEQMARYASILGVPFQSCESLESLNLALNGDMWKGLSLIDTPGLSPSDAAEADGLARFFKRRSEIEKHLVLRAEARAADISDVINRFSVMGVSRLLFTGLDETGSLESVAEAIVRSGIPVALAGTGPGIPEDLETVTAAWLARTRGGVAPRQARMTAAA